MYYSLTYNAKYFHKLADSVEKLNNKEYHLLLGPNKKPLPFYALPNRKIQILSNLRKISNFIDFIDIFFIFSKILYIIFCIF